MLVVRQDTLSLVPRLQGLFLMHRPIFVSLFLFGITFGCHSEGSLFSEFIEGSDFLPATEANKQRVKTLTEQLLAEIPTERLDPAQSYFYEGDYDTDTDDLRGFDAHEPVVALLSTYVEQVNRGDYLVIGFDAVNDSPATLQNAIGKDVLGLFIANTQTGHSSGVVRFDTGHLQFSVARGEEEPRAGEIEVAR